MNWFLTLLALACYSLLGLVLKSAAIKNNHPARLIWVALMIASGASLVAVLVSQSAWTWPAILIGLVSGVFFYLASVERVKALQTMPAGVVFAITNLDLVANSMIVALLPFLEGQLTWAKMLAIGLAALAILLASWSRTQEQSRWISPHTFISLALLVVSALGYTIYARLALPVFLFMFTDHLAGVLLNFRSSRSLTRSEIAWGAGIGALMFTGLWSLMTALQTSATISLVLIVVSLNTVMVAMLSRLVLKEKLMPNQIAALVLAVAASMAVILG
jgi:drug/metabolite transporter (DMT)-like permease